MAEVKAEYAVRASARQRVYALVRAHLLDQDEVHIPDIKQAVLNAVLDDRAWASEMLDDAVAAMIGDILQRFTARSRTHYVLRETIFSREAALARYRQRTRTRWFSFLEHCGNRHKLLATMTREDLFLAANERQSRGATEIRYAGVWREMIARMAPGQMVQEVFTEREIDQLFDRMTIHTETAVEAEDMATRGVA